MRKTLIATLLLVAGTAMPAFAQSDALPRRVDKLEREMRAVQRKVFPGGSGQTVEPDIVVPQAPPPEIGSPATAPLADLTARVDALESQLASLTGQAEQNANEIRLLQEAFTKAQADFDARIKALEPTAPPVAPTLDEGGGAVPPPAADAAPVAGDTAVQIARPSTGDAGEDAYLYGYRLWEAKRYAEAQAQLKTAASKYPSHKRISFTRNLLGRAYLDGGKPELAASAFLQNYQQNPRGERAPDSLYYLGQSFIQLKQPAKACQVYDEFNEVYGGTATAALKAQVAKGRTSAKCRAA
ncbi:TolA-binding protein [Sphingomonas zeicaulis]|uniref:tetratricopeptide repeat protein n=1 Tax=Sphingomonas zeicaulis TaxID=1632740 RepID=UPI003D2296B4